MTHAVIADGDFEIESNTATAEQIQANFAPDVEVETDARVPADGSDGAAPPAAADLGTDDDPGVSAKPPKVDKRTREGKAVSIQAEIDNLTHAKHNTLREVTEAQTKRDALRLELADLEAKRAPTQPIAAAVDPNDLEPREDDPKYLEKGYGQFVKDQAKWEARQEFKRLQSEARVAEHRTQREQTLHHVATNFATRLQTLNKAANEPDDAFYARVNPQLLTLRTALDLQPNERPTGANAVADVLAHDDNPRALMLHFTDHPDDLQRISTLHSSLALVEMGKLVQRLSAAPSGPASAPVISAAKPPIKPVGGSPIVSDDGSPGADDDIESFIAKGNRLDPRINPNAPRRH